MNKKKIFNATTLEFLKAPNINNVISVFYSQKFK